MRNDAQKVILMLLLLAGIRGFGSVALPSDGPYYRYRDDISRTLYIYDQKGAGFTDQLMGYTRAIRKQYEQSFGWRLDEEADSILTSPNQQIANAYATVIPNIKTVWFPSGAGMLEYMAQSSWLLALTTHETAHLYQLNAKSTVARYAKKIFGNAPLIYPFIPIFIHPNFLLPTFMLEGNAVMNESRFNLGGRLHSGEIRALVLAQIAAGDIDPNRLINDQLKFPFGETPYLQGGYFQAHLAAKYGVERTNKFFLAQSRHFVFPLILNKTFREHFGNSYPQEIREYVREMEGLARQQVVSPGKEEVRDLYLSPMNHDGGRIWLLSNSMTQNPRLHIFDKATRTWSVRQMDLAMGKVFLDDGSAKTAASERHDLHHIEYSLYGEDIKFDPAFRSQIVTDRRAGKTAALDAANSWLDPHLLVNGENYDIAHSSAIFDDKGSVYYFRQNGTQRILYRDRLPVFKFDGFYSKPTEVTADGAIYFIGSTDFGSTLYKYSGSEISRVLPSDRVVDARWISGSDFLVDEVDARGHRALIAQAQPKAATPAVYQYGFPSQSLVPDKTVPLDQIRSEERPYNSFSQIRYSGTQFFMSNSDDGLDVSAAAEFTDPMEYHALALAYSGTEHADKNYWAEYSFNKYLADVFVRYMLIHDRYKNWFDDEKHTATEQRGDLGLRLPLWKHRRWDAGFETFLYYKNEDAHYQPRLLETYGAFSSAGLNYLVAPPLGFMPWRQFGLKYRNELETPYNKFRKSDNTSSVEATFSYGLPKETYLTGFATAAWAETYDIDVEYNPHPLPGYISIPRLTDLNEYFVRQASAFRLEFHRAFYVHAYTPRFPVGITRVAPMFAVQQSFLNQSTKRDTPEHTFEYGFGLTTELLLVHKARAQFRIFHGWDDQNESSDLRFSFSLNRDF